MKFVTAMCAGFMLHGTAVAEKVMDPKSHVQRMLLARELTPAKTKKV